MTASAPFPSTTDLLRTAVDGDRAAWELLIDRFEPAVAAMITTYHLQDADARDAAQRTWLRMLESGPRIRQPEALGGWLRTTAKRECLRILSERRRVEQMPSLERTDPDVDVERSVLDAEATRQLLDAMAVLPARSVTLICALFRDDPPEYAELARQTGIPIGSIGPTRARALRRLRRVLDGAGSSASSASSALVS